MARRREGGLELIAAMPWPVGLVLGLIGFAAVRWGLPWFLGSFGGQLGAALASQLQNGTASVLAYLVLALCWIAAGVSYIGSLQRRRLLETQTGLESLRAMSWKQFEMLVGEAFRRQGYAIAETGLGGADGGVDLILRKDGRQTLVQCKQWKSRSVSVSTVREMWGLLSHHGADTVKIVCVGKFTRDAERFAEGKAIELIAGEQLLSMVRASQGASSSATATERVEPVLSAAPPAEASPRAPQCPKCEAGMTLRKNRRNGESFWGCDNYPGCRGTRVA